MLALWKVFWYENDTFDLWPLPEPATSARTRPGFAMIAPWSAVDPPYNWIWYTGKRVTKVINVTYGILWCIHVFLHNLLQRLNQDSGCFHWSLGHYRKQPSFVTLLGLGRSAVLKGSQSLAKHREILCLPTHAFFSSFTLPFSPMCLEFLPK